MKTSRGLRRACRLTNGERPLDQVRESMMKSMKKRHEGWVLFLLPVLLGGCSGSQNSNVAISPSTQRPAELVALGPRLVTKSTSIEANDVEFGIPKDYVFTLENIGDKPLNLEVHSKACACSEISLPAEIRPRQTGEVRIRWAPVPGDPLSKRLPTVLKTNDPTHDKLTLEIKAQINPRIRVYPFNLAYIDFDQLSAAKAERVIIVCSTKLNEFGLSASIRDGNEPPAYQVHVAPLEAGGTVIESQPIKSGYAVTVSTLDKLPQGYLRRDLLLQVTIPGESAREIVLPIYGKVENGIFTVAPSEVEFKVKNLADGDQARAVVNFLVPSPNEKVEVLRCEPSFIQAEAPKLATPDKWGRWTLNLRIPKDNPAAMKLQPEKFFEGIVYLKVSGSDTPVPIRVKWNP